MQEQVAAMEDCNNNTKQLPHSTAVSLEPAARIAVIGTGNFGTSLVTRLRQAGAEVGIYTVSTYIDSSLHSVYTIDSINTVSVDSIYTSTQYL